MEKTVVQGKQRINHRLQVTYVYISMIGLLIGSVASPLAYVFAFLYGSYFYMREDQECKLAIGGILIGSLLCGIFTTYLYALGFTIFFLIIHVLQLFKQNVYKALPLICAAISIPYSLYTFGLNLQVLVISFLTYALLRLDHKDFSWIQKKLVFTSTMYGVILISVAFLIQPWIPIEQQSLVVGALLFLTAFLCEPICVILLILLINSVLVEPLSLFVIGGMLCIGYGKKSPWLCSGALFILGMWLKVDLSQAVLLTIGGISSFLYDEKRLPFHTERHKENENITSTQSMLNKQINNFSSIFASLSEYYEQISDVEAQMLSDMAKALKYSADTIKKVDTKQSQKQRILKALEGYQYEVDSFEYEETSDGSLAMELDIRNIKKSEINQTLLPLLEVLTHEHLKVTEVKHHRFTSGAHHITLENHVPFQIDSYADSQKNMFETSGDSFSVFRFRNTVISMISDGMGSGEHAAASSRLITNIFQRMVVSGIPKADSIKCINKLLQSDAYATLDVVCFDCAAGKAYIFKSAACPTFLIRDGELYEVNGSSLPVGIISTIEPDCFVADLKEGDEYLIISDGIFMDEIYEWLKIRACDSVKASLEDLMKILRRKQRLDDSTAVLSKVQKA